MDFDYFTWCIIAILLVLFIIRQWLKPVMWHADGKVMAGKTVIITGANTGIGLETASELARYGAKVILACRDLSKAAKARQVIVDRLKHADGHSDIEERVVVEELDLASLDSIRAFAARMEKLERLDVLINNAGVGYMNERRLTKDGLELTMGTNHFGHFLLTNLLLDLLKKSAPSRIVVVSSVLHKRRKLEFDNLNSERSFHWMSPYDTSKLANIMFTRELARRLEGTDVTVNCLHPGVIKTELGRHLSQFMSLVLRLASFLLKSPLEGAQTTIYLSASQSPEVLESGNYFVDCRVEKPSADALDDAAAKKLWEVSERITKLA